MHGEVLRDSNAISVKFGHDGGRRVCCDRVCGCERWKRERGHWGCRIGCHYLLLLLLLLCIFSDSINEGLGERRGDKQYTKKGKKEKRGKEGSSLFILYISFLSSRDVAWFGSLAGLVLVGWRGIENRFSEYGFWIIVFFFSRLG